MHYFFATNSWFAINVNPNMVVKKINLAFIYFFLYFLFSVQTDFDAHLKGQSHEKVGEMSVWGISLGPN
jgi:hypothetical protein